MQKSIRGMNINKKRSKKRFFKAIQFELIQILNSLKSSSN